MKEFRTTISVKGTVEVRLLDGPRRELGFRGFPSMAWGSRIRATVKVRRMTRGTRWLRGLA